VCERAGIELAEEWTVGLIGITQRLCGKARAAFDVAAYTDCDQPARPGADSDPAIFFHTNGPQMRIA
jgi:hypothetical protein